MNTRLLYAVFFSILFMVTCCTGPGTAVHSLTDNIQQELSGQKGTFAVAFKDLSTGKEIRINDTATFHAASTMKTFVLIEVYKQVAEGKFSLSDSIVIKNEFKSIVDESIYHLDSTDDTEQELYKHIGEKRTINALVYEMIAASSNLAANHIIELVDAKKVTQTMRELGAKDIQVLRGVEDGKAFKKGLNNTTTAHDMLIIFEKMAQGKTVSPAASKAMINILLDQKFNDILPAQLPANVKVAHKIGCIPGIQHDAGIIYLPDGRNYVLVLLSKNLEDEKAAIKAMANVSSMIYNYFSKGAK